LAQNNEHFTIVDTAQEPNNPPYFNWLSQESGPMGKARNLALATSIAAVQEDSSALWQQPNQPTKPASVGWQ